MAGPALQETGLQLGAPGLYLAPPRPGDATISPVRLDVAAFVGVAPRGPVDTPVLVRTWDEYRTRFGSFQGPGKLPHAVAEFFAQGGDRAWVVRVGPHGARDDAAAAAAVHRLDPRRATSPAGPVRFAALGEGSWGAGLRLQLGFDVVSQFAVPAGDLNPLASPQGLRLVLPDTVTVPEGSLLLVRGAGTPPAGVLCWVTSSGSVDVLSGAGWTSRRSVAYLECVGGRPAPAGGVVRVSVITATLTVDDAATDLPRRETLTGLGLDPRHPRWLAGVVPAESLLVVPTGDWTASRVIPADTSLQPAQSQPEDGGGPPLDRYSHITTASFFTADAGDSPDDRETWWGVDALLHPYVSPPGAEQLTPAREIGLLCVPDLLFRYVDEGVASDLPDDAPEGFVECQPPVVLSYRDAREQEHLLDAVDDADVVRERQVLASSRADGSWPFVLLLDVPPGLSLDGIARWRSAFDSAYVAGYHPWLRVLRDAGDGAGARLVTVPPSAVATGIVAARELRRGIAFGPANELAAGVVGALSRPSPHERDQLHALAVNVFAAERDGYRLLAGRTLSRDPLWRQLSVRRLVTMVKLSVARRLEALVFEPNTPALRLAVTMQVSTFLAGIWRAGWLAGGAENEAYFVRCDDALNPAASEDQGRVVLEVGLAPAEPLEFIVLRISLSDDRLTSEERS